MEGPDEQFYDFGLANNTIERLQYAALPNNTARPFFIQSGFARPHAPWRVPQRFWDMYEHVNMPLAKYRTTIEGMAGVAWHQQGFYSAENGTVWVPMLDKPIPDAVQRDMRRAYYSAVSWVDHQVGRILTELDALGKTDETIVLLHGDHGWQ